MSTSLLKFLKNVDKNFIYYLSKMLAPIATVPAQTSTMLILKVKLPILNGP